MDATYTVSTGFVVRVPSYRSLAEVEMLTKNLEVRMAALIQEFQAEYPDEVVIEESTSEIDVPCGIEI